MRRNTGEKTTARGRLVPCLTDQLHQGEGRRRLHTAFGSCLKRSVVTCQALLQNEQEPFKIAQEGCISYAASFLSSDSKISPLFYVTTKVVGKDAGLPAGSAALPAGLVLRTKRLTCLLFRLLQILPAFPPARPSQPLLLVLAAALWSPCQARSRLGNLLQPSSS